MGGIAGAASCSDQVSDSSLHPLPPRSAVYCWHHFPGRSQKAKLAQNQRWQIPSSSSVTNCTDVINPPSSACLSLQPLTSRNRDPEMFLGAEKLEAESCLCQRLAQYLPVCVLHIHASGFECVCLCRKHILQQTNGNEIFQECLLNQVILGNLTAKVTSDFWLLFAQCGARAGLCPGRAPRLRGVWGPQHPEEKLCALRSMSRRAGIASGCGWNPELPPQEQPCLCSKSWRDLLGHAPAAAFTKRKEAGGKKSQLLVMQPRNYLLFSYRGN